MGRGAGLDEVASDLAGDGAEAEAVTGEAGGDDLPSADPGALNAASPPFDKRRPCRMMPRTHESRRGGSTMTRLAGKQTSLLRRQVDAAVREWELGRLDRRT